MSAGAEAAVERCVPIGADVSPDGVHFRVWAPVRRRVDVAIEERDAAGEFRVVSRHALTGEPGGYFAGLVSEARTGMLYRYLLDDGNRFPDPASRFQPYGPHGPSMIVDPSTFEWHDAEWCTRPLKEHVVYELHIGTFTPEGTWKAAQERLPHLLDLGVSLIEVMPVADFPGTFGWGYDGVNLFAPSRLYGEPDDFRRFVDAAHAAGVSVILDVVYNHFGPDGCYLREFSSRYFSPIATEWGDAINYDGEGSGAVREMAVENARYWIREFHLDGLRLDATQSVHDFSREHVLAELARKCRADAGDRRLIFIAENEPQRASLVRPATDGGFGLDALWNDDFHHTARVAATGRREAYFADYLGTPQEFISAAKHGFLFQGQRYSWQRKHRGEAALDLPAHSFVTFLQNHDQVANSLRGVRLHNETAGSRLRALTALLMLGPQVPMLFMGQEWAASSPYLFFAGHTGELARLVREGRRGFLAQYPSITDGAAAEQLDDPSSEQTFRKCVLNWNEAGEGQHAEMLALHRDLIALRRTDGVLLGTQRHRVDGAVLPEGQAFVLRYFGGDAGDRLMLVNLSRELHLAVIPEPLLAPPRHKQWQTRWSSEDVRYGGRGVFPLETTRLGGWIGPAESTTLLMGA